MSNWIDRHSVNCYFCGKLVDERDCLPADDFNDDDGGSICPACYQNPRYNPALIEDEDTAKDKARQDEEAGFILI